MGKPTYVFGSLVSIAGQAAAQSGEFDNAIGGRGVVELITAALAYVGRILYFPGLGADQTVGVVVWLSGLVFVVAFFRYVIKEFSNRFYGNIDKNFQRVFTLALSGLFIGGTPFMNWLLGGIIYVQILALIVAVGAVVRTLGMATGTSWNLIGNQGSDFAAWATSGTKASLASEAMDRLTSQGGRFDFFDDTPISDAWDYYQSIPKCPKGHLNPQHSDTTGPQISRECFVCGRKPLKRSP